MSVLDKLSGKNVEGQGGNDQKLNQLKQKYAAVLNLIEQSGVRLQNVHIENEKLYIRGQAPSEDVKNRIWDQVKLVDATYSDLTLDIDAPAASAQGAQGTSAKTNAPGKTHTVKPGDTLSKIAKEFYGDANAYMEIFNANRDKLKDPNMIQPGQVLTIPPR